MRNKTLAIIIAFIAWLTPALCLGDWTKLTVTMDFDKMHCYGTTETVGMSAYSMQYHDNGGISTTNAYFARNTTRAYWSQGSIKSIKIYVTTKKLLKIGLDGKWFKYYCVGEATKTYNPPLKGLDNMDTLKQ